MIEIKEGKVISEKELEEEGYTRVAEYAGYVSWGKGSNRIIWDPKIKRVLNIYYGRC